MKFIGFFFFWSMIGYFCYCIEIIILIIDMLNFFWKRKEFKDLRGRDGERDRE